MTSEGHYRASACRHARRFAEGFGAADEQVLNEVVLSRMLVSFGDAETISQVVAVIQVEGSC